MTVGATTDQIEPFFFGPEDRRLFGSYHEPQGWPSREQGVIICYPFGQEYIRSHRACRHLAAQIARAGFPTLRFDYFGTGDSLGTDEETNFEQWHADLRKAVAELRARSGVEQVILVGLRLGASLALSAASQTADLAGLVLWEPVVNGRNYLNELRAQHEETIMRFFVLPKDYQPAAQPAELLGFALSDTMRASLEQVDLLTLMPPRARPVLLVENQPTADLAALNERLAAGGKATHAHVPCFTVWIDDVDKGLVPQQVIDTITAWLDRVFQ